MDLLDRLLGHDAWTTRQLLLLAAPLTDEQWARPFDIGHRTLRETVEHMLFNVETWTDLMNGAPDPGARAEYAGLDAAGLLARHDAALAAF
ncbi:MAG: DinB family protein, partial [Thermomicrobiales bacterium]